MGRLPVLCTAFLLAFATPALAQPFSMMLPGGGETWTVGTTHTIEWGGGPPGTVNLILYNVTLFTNAGTIASGTPNDGMYSWTVPPLPAGTYGVYIEAASQSDWLYGPGFTINAPPTCAVGCQLASVAMPYFEPPAGVCGQTHPEAQGFAQAWAQANFACPNGTTLDPSTMVIDVSFLPIGVCLPGYTGGLVYEASAVACCCAEPTSSRKSTWGRVKTIYR